MPSKPYEEMTPHERAIDCLNEAIGLLANDPCSEADALCDRIMALVNPGFCEYRAEPSALLPGEVVDWLKGLRCKNVAHEMVYSQQAGKVLRVCETHRRIVSNDNNAEYDNYCENCGCMNSVN